MKYFDWDELKNAKLKAERDVCFEDVIVAMSEGHLVKIIKHPNPAKYLNQKVDIIELEEYIYCVPFVEDEEKIFLKTIYPSRKLTKRYLEGRNR